MTDVAVAASVSRARRPVDIAWPRPRLCCQCPEHPDSRIGSLTIRLIAPARLPPNFGPRKQWDAVKLSLIRMVCVVEVRPLVIMAAVPFYFTPVVSSSFFFSSPVVSRRRFDVCRHDVAFSANSECRSEMCCTRLAANTASKKSPRIRHLRTVTQFCRAVFSQLSQILTVGKILNSNTSSTCSYNMVNFGPLTAEMGSLVWSTPANFNGFHDLASLVHRRRSTDVKQTLHYVWPSPGLVHYTISGALAP